MRRFFVQLHLWIGLVAGIILLLMAVTGAIMAFRDEIRSALHPGFYTVTPAGPALPLERLVEIALRLHPESEIDYLRLSVGREASVCVRFVNEDALYLNPYTGEMLGLEDAGMSFFGVTERLHRFLLLPIKAGRIVIGTAALAFLFLFASGLYLWLPAAWRHLRAALTFNPLSKGRARWLSLHKLAGIYAGIFVAVSALTGLPKSFDWYKRGLATVTMSPKPAPLPKVAVKGPFLPLQSLWEKALEAVPGTVQALVHLPDPATGTMDIYQVERDAPHPNARTYLCLGAATGEVLRLIPYASATLGQKLYFLTISLHLGQWKGAVGKLIITISSLGLAFLVVTGGISFYRRKFAAGRPAARIGAKDESEASELAPHHELHS